MVDNPFEHPQVSFSGKGSSAIKKKCYYNLKILLKMVFVDSDLTAVDFKTIQPGQVATATLTSFSYRKDYCFATVVADKKSVTAIIGAKQDYPIKDMLALKGIEVKVIFTGTKVVDGVTYPRYTLEF